MNTMTIVGNLTADPKEHSDSSGVQFAVASNRRYTTKGGEEVKQTIFKDVVAWGELGQHVLASLHKGDRVVVQGYIEQSTYSATDTSGNEVTRTRDRLVASVVGAELRFATVEISRIASPTRTAEPEPVSL